MHVQVKVWLKDGIANPTGEDFKRKLVAEGLLIQSLSMGKHFDLQVEVKTKAEARKIVTIACEKLLANQVIEEFEIEFPPDKKKSRR